MTVYKSESAVVDQVTWRDPDARAMRDQLSEEMGVRYADREAIPGHLPPEFFVEESTVSFAAVARLQGLPVGHIAIRCLRSDLELKNMYVIRPCRGVGIADMLLDAAEAYARVQGASRMILQTGDRQPEAIRFYCRRGYMSIPVYDPYKVMPYSNCFEKRFL